LQTAHGRLGFSILLFQDVAAIPILALIPALALAHPTDSPGAGHLAPTRLIVTISRGGIGGR
jgi:glutathione-regulated potassium-efflux system protein KefB